MSAHSLAATLDPDDLLDEVLQANPDLQARSARIDVLRAQIAQAAALDDPRLTVAVSPASVGSEIGARGSLTVSQALPWPGKRQLRTDSASAVAATAVAEQQLRSRELVFEARNAWAQWWYLHRALAINADNQRLLDELIPVVETQYGAGLGRQQDVLQAQTRAVHNRHQRVVLNQQQRRVAALLNILRNQAPTATVAAPAAYPLLAKAPSTARLEQELLLAHPSLAVIARQQQAAEAALSLAQKDRYPDFVVNSGYVGMLDPAEKRLQIGVGINIPLQRERRRAAEDAARARLLELQANDQERLLRLQGELESALANADEAEHVIHLYQSKLLRLANQNLNAARADYESGAGDFNAVIDAAQQTLNFRLELARARADRLIARAQITQLTGTPWLQSEAPHNKEITP